jgi:prefoldin subunit 5
MMSDDIEYLQNQNKYLKKKLEELTRKYKDLEHEFDRLYEENQNIRLVRNEGKVL